MATTTQFVPSPLCSLPISKINFLLSVNVDSTRPYTNMAHAIDIPALGPGTWLVTTDGHRAHAVLLPGVQPNVSVPRAVLKDVAKGRKDKIVSFQTIPTPQTFETGMPPNIAQVFLLPSPEDIEVTTPTELLQVLACVPGDIVFSTNPLRLGVYIPQVGLGWLDQDIKPLNRLTCSTTPDDLSVCKNKPIMFDAKYLGDVALMDPTAYSIKARLNLASNLKPTIFRLERGEDDMVAVVMPRRL